MIFTGIFTDQQSSAPSMSTYILPSNLGHSGLGIVNYECKWYNKFVTVRLANRKPTKSNESMYSPARAWPQLKHGHQGALTCPFPEPMVVHPARVKEPWPQHPLVAQACTRTAPRWVTIVIHELSLKSRSNCAYEISASLQQIKLRGNLFFYA